MIKINCKKYADDILDKVSQIEEKGELVIITTDHDPASKIYVKGKLKDAERCGIRATKVAVSTQEELEDIVCFNNGNSDVAGIIVQLPLLDNFDEEECVNLVSIHKDVDGFKYGSPFLPCTPEGIMHVLRKELGDLTGKTALVIGRGKLVGEPMAKLLLKANCTVTVAHSKTRNLEGMLKSFDIIVTGVGVPNLIDLKKCDAEVVIDTGVDCYNFDPNDDSNMKVAVTPNGIGLMTRAMLMAHVARMEDLQ